jgi:hypothetical protein
MARGNVGNTKVFYQGSGEGFVVFVESEEIVRQWKDDKTVPLTDVVAGWKIFTTEYVDFLLLSREAGGGWLLPWFGEQEIVHHFSQHHPSLDRMCHMLTYGLHRHGKQGVLNTASNSQLENEFGTKNEDDVVKQILEKGDIQSSEVCHFEHEVLLHTPCWLSTQNPERQGNTNDSKGSMQAH